MSLRLVSAFDPLRTLAEVRSCGWMKNVDERITVSQRQEGRDPMTNFNWPFALMAVIAAANIAYGLITGRNLSAWRWVQRDEQPTRYWFSMVGPIGALTACIWALVYL